MEKDSWDWELVRRLEKNDPILNDRPGPGKFEGNHSLSLSEKLHEITMDGCNEELGDVQGFGWYGLILSPFEGEEIERLPLSPMRKGPSFIVAEDSNGFFTYTEFDDEDAALQAWHSLEEEYSTFMEEEE